MLVDATAAWRNTEEQGFGSKPVSSTGMYFTTAVLTPMEIQRAIAGNTQLMCSDFLLIMETVVRVQKIEVLTLLQCLVGRVCRKGFLWPQLQQHIIEQVLEYDHSTLQECFKRDCKRKRDTEEFKMVFLGFTNRTTATPLKWTSAF